MKRIEIDSLSKLPTVAREILGSLNGRNIVLFRAGMGGGKTTLIREIVAQLGSTDCVTSPTFAIVNQYESAEGDPIYHFDLYRVTKLAEALDFGCDEYFASGDLCLVEWPDVVEELLPEDSMVVTIELGKSDNERIFTIE